MRVVIINTVNGKFRFEERSVKNFSEFNNVEQLLSGNTFCIELERNMITFLVKNVISIEITAKNYVMSYS